MRRAGRLAVVLAAGLAGALAGAAITMAVQPDAPAADPVRPTETRTTAPPPRTAEPPDTLLAWTPGRLPEGFAAAAARVQGVRHVAVVRSGTVWLTGSASATGAVVDRPPAGLAIPLELAAVDPAAYRAFLPPADRPLLGAVARGEVVLGEASARLRGLGEGATLRFGAVTARVAGVLPDEFVGAHEVLGSYGLGARLGVERARYSLLDPSAAVSRTAIARGLRTSIPAGTPLRVRAPGETPYFRHGDAVLPPITLKEAFGEFAARSRGDGWLDVDPAWVRTHVRTAAVPILGRVTCASALFPQLRGALGDLERAGLGHLLDPGDFGGCFAPRFLSRDPGAGISHHAWGAAIDVNVSSNPFGRVPSMDPRIVEAFERWGFTWGGRWLVPDGMHFDFIRAVVAPAA
jgi:D-alanyl-D-alanine carboxypeptidase-like protein